MTEWTWDPDKDRLNRRKHQGLGSAAGIAVLLIVYTAPVAGPDGREIGRIISVRKATPHGRRAYEERADG